MGILDDVTHSGDTPPIEKNGVVFFDATEEEVQDIESWLLLAEDIEKQIVVDGPITKTFYSHPRINVKNIFTGFRKQAESALGLKTTFMKKYYTVSYSNLEDFEYIHNTVIPTEDGEDIERLHFALVLNGKAKTSVSPENVLERKNAYFMLSSTNAETLFNAGEEDTKILCFLLNFEKYPEN